MTVKITYFVHGTTIDNEKDISSGWSDTELSALGVKQSLELKTEIHEYEPRKFLYRPGQRKESPEVELKEISELIAKNI
jgi:broad specificity phosphatase PhoE